MRAMRLCGRCSRPTVDHASDGACPDVVAPADGSCALCGRPSGEHSRDAFAPQCPPTVVTDEVTAETVTRVQRLASIDATVAATSRDRDDCDPGRAFARRSELDEDTWPEYRAEFEASFVRMVARAAQIGVR